MKRAVIIIAAFIAVTLLTVAAQAAVSGEQILQTKMHQVSPNADMDALIGYMRTLK